MGVDPGDCKGIQPIVTVGTIQIEPLLRRPSENTKESAYWTTLGESG
jgi:hypothetical protein